MMTCLQAMSKKLFFLIALLGTTEASCYYSYYYSDYYCYSYTYTYTSSGTIAGSIVGALIVLAIVIGLIVFFCCIRPRRMIAHGTVISGGRPGVAVVQTGQVFSSGHNNRTMYPPQTATYPQTAYQLIGGTYSTQQHYAGYASPQQHGAGYAPSQQYGVPSPQQQYGVPPPQQPYNVPPSQEHEYTKPPPYQP